MWMEIRRLRVFTFIQSTIDKHGFFSLNGWYRMDFFFFCVDLLSERAEPYNRHYKF